MLIIHEVHSWWPGLPGMLYVRKKKQFISVTMPYRVNVKSYKNFLTAVLPLFLICTSHFSFLPSPFFSFLSFNIFAWFHNTTSIKLTVKKLQVASV